MTDQKTTSQDKIPSQSENYSEWYNQLILRSELADLEQYVLLNVYDSTWKDHLYMMDRLKDEIWTRSLAEKDPKVEYKREGFRMFNEMLESIDDRVTDVIFRVRLEERLLREVGLFEPDHPRTENADRHRQRHFAGAVALERIEEEGLLV